MSFGLLTTEMLQRGWSDPYIIHHNTPAQIVEGYNCIFSFNGKQGGITDFSTECTFPASANLITVSMGNVWGGVLIIDRNFQHIGKHQGYGFRQNPIVTSHQPGNNGISNFFNMLIQTRYPLWREVLN